MNYLEINNCKHYFLNHAGENKMFFTDSPFMVEIDYMTKHPFGTVYKPKGIIDTPMRFVKQPNNSILMFKATEWNIKGNSYYQHQRSLRNDIIEAYYNQTAYL